MTTTPQRVPVHLVRFFTVVVLSYLAPKPKMFTRQLCKACTHIEYQEKIRIDVLCVEEDTVVLGFQLHHHTIILKL